MLQRVFFSYCHLYLHIMWPQLSDGEDLIGPKEASYSEDPRQTMKSLRRNCIFRAYSTCFRATLTALPKTRINPEGFTASM